MLVVKRCSEPPQEEVEEEQETEENMEDPNLATHLGKYNRSGNLIS